MKRELAEMGRASAPPAAAKRLGDILRRDIPPGAVVVLHQANDRTKEIELQTYGTVLTSANYVRLFIIIHRSYIEEKRKSTL